VESPILKEANVTRCVYGHTNNISPLLISSSTKDSDYLSFSFHVDIQFSPNATLAEIFEAMKHPVNGVGFFSQTQSLPSCTFVSYDALMWLKTRLNNGRHHPLDLLEAMRKWVTLLYEE